MQIRATTYISARCYVQIWNNLSWCWTWISLLADAIASRRKNYIFCLTKYIKHRRLALAFLQGNLSLRDAILHVGSYITQQRFAQLGETRNTDTDWFLRSSFIDVQIIEKKMIRIRDKLPKSAQRWSAPLPVCGRLFSLTVLQ